MFSLELHGEEMKSPSCRGLLPAGQAVILSTTVFSIYVPKKRDDKICLCPKCFSAFRKYLLIA